MEGARRRTAHANLSRTRICGSSWDTAAAGRISNGIGSKGIRDTNKNEYVIKLANLAIDHLLAGTVIADASSRSRYGNHRSRSRTAARVIEIGCVELFNRRLTGRPFPSYLNPERDITKARKPCTACPRASCRRNPPSRRSMRISRVSCGDAELVIHNAPFDVRFLDAEFGGWGRGPRAHESPTAGRVLDTLALARQMHPGRATAWMPCGKRYSVGQLASRTTAPCSMPAFSPKCILR